MLYIAYTVPFGLCYYSLSLCFIAVQIAAVWTGASYRFTCPRGRQITNKQHFQIIFGQLRRGAACLGPRPLKLLSSLSRITCKSPYPHFPFIVLLCNSTDYEIVDSYYAAPLWQKEKCRCRCHSRCRCRCGWCLVLAMLLYIKHIYASLVCLLMLCIEIEARYTKMYTEGKWKCHYYFYFSSLLKRSNAWGIWKSCSRSQLQFLLTYCRVFSCYCALFTFCFGAAFRHGQWPTHGAL